MSEKRIIMPEAGADDLHTDFADGGTRPLRFDDFIGQRPVCENLKVFIQPNKQYILPKTFKDASNVSTPYALSHF